MKISLQGIELIKSFEGFRSMSYKCPGGYWTIGYGHVFKEEELCQYEHGIAEKEGQYFLEQDICKVEKSLKRLVYISLSQNQVDALGSFTFNVGAGALQRSTLRRIINRQEHAQVPQELLKWVWAAGKKHRGLIKRREIEGEVYLSAF